jgi:hypothetical protein
MTLLEDGAAEASLRNPCKWWDYDAVTPMTLKYGLIQKVGRAASLSK